MPVPLCIIRENEKYMGRRQAWYNSQKDGASGYYWQWHYTEHECALDGKIDGFIIYGVSGSAAETYANKFGITFVELKQHTVKFMNGSDVVSTQKVTDGENATAPNLSKKDYTLSWDKSYNLTKNAFKRSGYKFVGWNTKANGSGKTYKNAAEIKNLTSKNGKKVTLYAQWKKK